MKKRNGFVSNSSSSSFVIAKVFMTKEQQEELRNWRPSEDAMNEEWYLDESDGYFICSNAYYASKEIIDLMLSMEIPANKYYFTDC